MYGYVCMAMCVCLYGYACNAWMYVREYILAHSLYNYKQGLHITKEDLKIPTFSQL